MSPDQPPRTDCNGDPCPSWCTGTHLTRVITVHQGGSHSVKPPDGLTGARPFWLAATATQTTTPWRGTDPASVSISGSIYKGPDALADVSATEAANLAAIIEILGNATPEQHRELAEAIREAAAEITGPQPEAGS